MKAIKLILTLTLLLTVTTAVKAQNLNLYERTTYIAKSDTLPYRILFPENFDATKKYPLIFFLHGSGERGNDNEMQLMHGGELFASDEVRKKFPAIVVFPQCAQESYWSNVTIQVDSAGKKTFTFDKANSQPTKAMKSLIGLTNRLAEKPFIDKNRIYVGGLSMGGMGTFELLRRMPNFFAAAFSICGGDNVSNVEKYKKVPLWIFHGADDDVVPLSVSEEVVSVLKKKGSKVKFTVYPGVKHNSWDNVFVEPEFLPWLFSQKK